MTKILQKKSPILRKQAKEVPVKDIKSKKIQDILKKMSAVLATQDDGVAIAAPQIGVSLRIFIVGGRLLTKKDEETRPDMVFINPVIMKVSRKKQKMEEGCLSVRWLYGQVERSEKATVRAHDEHGKPFTKGASGVLAQAFQHEMDHLNGILFIDKATDLEDLPPEKMVKDNQAAND
ncbi:peptide deformylase [Candidatus Parcubacteria bacterium]|nr:peptide deformylase [Candidatus Parcubacteria bacterium]